MYQKINKKHYRTFLIAVFCAALLFTFSFIKKYVNNQMPDHLNVYSVDDISLKTSFPVSYNLKDKNVEVSAGYGKTFVSYTLKTKAFGIIPLKNISVNVIDKVYVYPCGTQIGIYLQTNGVMVIGTGEVVDVNGHKSNPCQNIIKENDYIVSINDIDVNSKSQLIFLINKYGSDDIVLGIRRGKQNIKVRVTPVKCSDKEYMIGIWVRDDSQGIGTLTYITDDEKFGALGHGISDIDTKKLLSSTDGILYKADIWGINKGENGNPGGILGSITYEKSNEYGEITNNTWCGIFGDVNSVLKSDIQKQNPPKTEICLKQDIKKGKAYIRTSLSGKSKDYEILINNINYNHENKGKSIEIEIVDKELLELTNGIVQGMSGSPIIQNGKLVGAVTHVFVDDPTRGYGIFIEEMLEHN